MKNTIERTPSTASIASKLADLKKTTVTLDAVLVAKIRASLRAVGLNTDIGEHIEKSLESELEDNSGFFEAWIEDETTPRGREIEEKLERIRNGDKRLVRPEPLPCNAFVHRDLLERLRAVASADDVPIGSAINALLRVGLDKVESGEWKYKMRD